MRTRSSLSNPKLTPCVLQYREFWGGTWYPWNSLCNGLDYIDQDYKEMTDQKTPGYFKAVRENTVIPVSPMTHRKETYTRIRGGGDLVLATTADPDAPRWGFRYDGFVEPQYDERFGVKPTLDDSNAGDLALQEALSRAQTDCWDALTFAAEFRKTVEGVVTLRSRAMIIFERFQTKVLKSKGSKRYRGLEFGQILAEIWLEMRYVWRPLVYDLAAMQEATVRLMQGVEDPLQRAYASRVDSASSADTAGSYTFSTPDQMGSCPGMMLAIIKTVNVERSVHAAVGLIARTRETTMVDPFVTAWELVPYSFVLDWFITIGDMLSAFSPFATGELQYATLATTETTTYRSSFKPIPHTGYVVLDGSVDACTFEYEVEVYNRVAATPTPTLSFDVNLNVAKIIDLTALWVTQNNKSLKRLLRHF